MYFLFQIKGVMPIILLLLL